MKLVTVFFLLLVFSITDYSLSQSASASKPKSGASASGSVSAPKSSPQGGASGSVSAPKSSPKAGAGGSVKLPEGYVISGKTKDFIMAVKLNKKKESWNGARKACFHEGHGAFLAYPESKEEENMYLKMMKDNKVNDLWVGLHDLFENNGQYSTVRGEVAKEAAYFTWYPGEPNSNRGSEPCAEYRIAHGKKGLNDRRCHFQFPYMCKIKIPQPKK